MRIATRQSLSQGDLTVTGGSRVRHVRDWLMAAEVSLAVVLLTGSVIALESYWALSHIQLGFASHNVLTASITPPAEMESEQKWLSYKDAMRDAYPAAGGALSRRAR